MKKRFAAGLLAASLLLVLSALAVGRPAAGGKNTPGKRARKNYVPGEVLVKFRPGTDEWDRDQARRGIRAGKHRRLGRIGVEKVKLPPGMSVKEAVKTLEDDPRVEYAEPNSRVVYLGMPTLTPDDPLIGNQWYLDKAPIPGFVGTRLFSVDVDIDAPEAWGVMGSTFDSAMTAGVGVLDSGDGSAGFFSDSVGYLPSHEDLPNSLLFVNAGEASGISGSDDDSNGYIDDVNGWDWADSPNDNAPADTPVDPGAPYHGTRISGIIAAAWGNSTGIAGIGMDALRVLPLRGKTVFAYASAISYAASLADTGENVRVLNASWALVPQGADNQVLRDAVTDAGASGLLFVAAAGNYAASLSDLNNDSVPVYPASYSTALSNVLSVAASDSTGDLAYFSHFGPASVQIAAPGRAIYATSGGTNGYAYVSGTSFAAPIAASALGLIMAADGPGTIPSVAISRLLDGGDFDARLAGVVKSGKRVNLAGALAPFHPWSGLAPMDTTVPISMYADSIGAMYATFTSAVSSSPSVAVLTGDAASGWAVSPVSPGIATFTLSFTNAPNPIGSWETGPWRVTGIDPFTAGPAVGDTVAFTSLVAIAGTPSWSVADTSVGSIDPDTGVFTALAEGRTRVSLAIGGSPADTSGYVTVVNPPPSGGGGGGCFIATAAFGSYEAPAVRVLRDFRDADLLTNGPGRRFVAAYYRYSPPAAQWLDDHPRLKPAVRVLLLPLVGFAWVSLKIGLAWAAWLLALLLMSLVFPAWKFRSSW